MAIAVVLPLANAAISPDAIRPSDVATTGRIESPALLLLVVAAESTFSAS
jgi:hypothetical protein